MLSRPLVDRTVIPGITWYALLIVIAIVIGYLLSSRESKKQGLPEDIMLDFLLLAIPLGVIGARLYYVFFRWSDYSEDLLSVLYIHEGGLAIYGGILGGLLAVRLTSRKHHVSQLQLLDILAPALILGQAIGRWGNYINMEAYGLRISEEYLQFFPFAVEIPVGQTWYWHLATFFYEFCIDLVIFGLLYLVHRHKRRTGDVFFWYLLLYTSARTVIEGLRDDSLTFISDFVRISQVLSAIAALAMVVLFFLRIRDRISAVTILPLVQAVLCLILCFLGEFERNAYSFLFKYSQIFLLLTAVSEAAIIILWTLDSGAFDLKTCLPSILCIVFVLIIFVVGLGRQNEDNTYYVTFRQIAAMLQLCVSGWLLCYPLCAQHKEKAA